MKIEVVDAMGRGYSDIEACQLLEAVPLRNLGQRKNGSGLTLNQTATPNLVDELYLPDRIARRCR
jgi:hypothetical protein